MSKMEASQSSMSMSRDASQANCIDPLDSLIDFSEYENMNYNSPSVSPADTKNLFVQPEVPTSRASTILPSQQVLSGPSHPYDMHKQQTGLPAGGLATTMAINSQQQMYAGNGYLSGVSPETDFIVNTPQFQTYPSSGSFESMNMVDFETPAEAGFFFPPLPAAKAGQEFVKPSNLVASNNAMQQQQPGRIFPGMHQQQAMMKAQQQQKHQMQQRGMQQQRQGSIPRPAPQQKSKVRPATDPIVEEKISQLLNSMRQNSMATTANDDDDDMHHGNGQHGRSRKDEEDMDEDERLLASEEGKKLSSKERRQLRNKVSARAFRSRRKEYIGQLEGEIASKVNENQRLFTENKALIEENNRLTDLTRLLLGSPAFSQFLNELSTNPTTIPQQPRQQPTPPTIEQPQQMQPEPRQQQIRKDVNPYTAQQQAQQNQNMNQDMNINFAILPEQTMDFSMLDLVNQDYMFQPQVFSVHSVPEFTFDSSILSEKPSHEETYVENDAKDFTPIFTPAKSTEVVLEKTEQMIDKEFDANPQFELFTSSTAATTSKSAEESPLDIESIVTNIQPAKAFLKFELVSEQETNAAMRRVKRLQASLDAVTARLEKMTCQ